MTYAERVKLDVSLRYGVPVCCDVRLIPRGMSASWPHETEAGTAGGIHPRSPRFKYGRNAIPLEEQREIFRLFEMGVKLSDIARRLSRSKSLVHGYLN